MSQQERTTSSSSASSGGGRQASEEKRDTGKGKVQEVAEQARQAAEQRVESVRESADAVRERAVERVRKLGQAVRKIGEHMRVEEQVYIAERANDASQRIDAVAEYIAQAELASLLDDAESLARRRPAAVLGGAFLIGLAAGRFFKAPGIALRGAASARPRAPERPLSANAAAEAPR